MSSYIHLYSNKYKIFLRDRYISNEPYAQPITRYEDGTLKVHLDKKGYRYVKVKGDKVLFAENSSLFHIPSPVSILIQDPPIMDIPMIRERVSHDCISHILEFLPKQNDGEGISLITTLCDDPIFSIYSYTRWMEDMFDPCMVTEFLPEKDINEWNYMVNTMFKQFLSARPHCVTCILQGLRNRIKESEELNPSSYIMEYPSL